MSSDEFARSWSPNAASQQTTETRLLSTLVVGLSCCAMALIGCDDHRSARVGLVVVGTAVRDFGPCHPGETLTHSFTIQNQSPNPIKISKISSSCGCLVAGDHVGEEAIAPGATATVPISFDIRGATDMVTGIINLVYHVQASMNAKDEISSGRVVNKPSVLTLRVNASSVPDYRIGPTEIDFGEIDGLKSQTATRVLSVSKEAMQDFELVGAESTSELITAKITRGGVSADYLVEVTLDVSGFSESRPFDASLVLLTNSERVPRSRVPVHAKYRAPVSIHPGSIVISSAEEGEINREVRVTTSCDSRLLKIECSNDRVACEYDAQQESRQHMIRLVVPRCGATDLDCELMLEFDLLDGTGGTLFRSLRLPVYRFTHERKHHAT